MLKLNSDEQDLLESLVLSDSWPVVLKLLDSLIEDQARTVLNYVLEDKPEGLILAKAKYDGACKLARSVQQLKKVYLKKQG